MGSLVIWRYFQSGIPVVLEGILSFLHPSLPFFPTSLPLLFPPFISLSFNYSVHVALLNNWSPRWIAKGLALRSSLSHRRVKQANNWWKMNQGREGKCDGGCGWDSTSKGDPTSPSGPEDAQHWERSPRANPGRRKNPMYRQQGKEEYKAERIAKSQRKMRMCVKRKGKIQDHLKCGWRWGGEQPR